MASPGFDSYRSRCSAVKGTFARLFASVPETFSIRKDGSRVYFLGAMALSGNSLFSVETEEAEGTRKWKTVISPSVPKELTRSEQLLRERMRASGSGITNYEYLESCDSLLADTGTGYVLLSCDEQGSDKVMAYPNITGAIDYKLCLWNKNILLCVSEGDLYLLSSLTNTTIQLTNTKAERPGRKVTAGQASFIMQEEFDRYTGYWWSPSQGEDGTYHVLYEEVDETKVEVVHTFNPSKQEVEDYPYPRPGKTNATSVLKLLKFHVDDKGSVQSEHYKLAPSIASYLSRWEYLAGMGWTPDGKRIWVHALDREQHKCQLLFISIDSFVRLEAEGDSSVPSPVLIWEESRDIWINFKNTSCLKFLPSTETSATRLLITSEHTGHPHLVLLEGNLPSGTGSGKPVEAGLIAREVTKGAWNVMGSKVWIDGDRNLVYFEGNKSSPLDRHLYAVKLDGGELPTSDPTQLTPSEYYHHITLDPERGIFVSAYSNQATPTAVAVYSINHASLEANYLFHIWKAPETPSTFTAPTNFTTQSCTGETLYGMVYPPINLKKGTKYRTIVYVYGGPEFQVVTNEFSRFIMRISQFTHADMAVMLLDNRGSSNRGSAFEAHIKLKMGSAEVEDQVAGLLAAAEAVDYIDLQRVGIYGWSYGGYMSLMALVKQPEMFKVAVAGAPVTDWMWYDTGYTERYLGVPPDTRKAYQDSSVVTLAPLFPKQLDRLLIVHGMNDENVLYSHTSLLLDAFVSHGIPYQVQLFTGERHGIRNPVAAGHCDATVLHFFTSKL